ncbi:MAG: hypothetical protein ACRCVL_08175, partial [Cetobacterium sp.]
TSVVEVGGKGGQPFNFNGMNNQSLLKKIKVWEGDLEIKAVKVFLTDDRSEEFGVPDGNLKEFTFVDEEIFALPFTLAKSSWYTSGCHQIPDKQLPGVPCMREKWSAAIKSSS